MLTSSVQLKMKIKYKELENEKIVIFKAYINN